MKYHDLTVKQRRFVEKNIFKAFGAMPKNPDEAISVCDCYGYEASYMGLIMRPETAEEKEQRWGHADPIKVARMVASKDVIARQVVEDLCETGDI